MSGINQNVCAMYVIAQKPVSQEDWVEVYIVVLGSGASKSPLNIPLNSRQVKSHSSVAIYLKHLIWAISILFTSALNSSTIQCLR